ncbi:MAG: chromosome segregation ATPase [Verrucomicrobiales bacterium]|jgi:chromosome segregation ATPase
MLELSPRITCLVGPDGCGKSSIISSILWAVGGKSNGEVFRGTDSKQPSASASVSLTFVDGHDRHRVTRTTGTGDEPVLETNGVEGDSETQGSHDRFESLLTVIDSIDGLLNTTSADHNSILLLDEVEARLEGGEIVRFASLLLEYSCNHQIIVASHFKSTMTVADMIVGVTMEEYGVSKLIDIKRPN